MNIIKENVFPFSSIGIVLCIDKDGNNITSTGTIVGRNIILTALHCIINDTRLIDDMKDLNIEEILIHKNIYFLPNYHITKEKTIPWKIITIIIPKIIKGIQGDYCFLITEKKNELFISDLYKPLNIKFDENLKNQKLLEKLKDNKNDLKVILYGYPSIDPLNLYNTIGNLSILKTKQFNFYMIVGKAYFGMSGGPILDEYNNIISLLSNTLNMWGDDNVIYDICACAIFDLNFEILFEISKDIEIIKDEEIDDNINKFLKIIKT